MASPRRTVIFGSLAALLAIAATLAAVEGGLRGYHAAKDILWRRSLPPVAERCLVPSADPELGFELNPGWSRDGFTVNRFGMADENISEAKSEGSFRIAVAGDSITCNWELSPRAEHYVTVLGEIARGRVGDAVNVQTLNFGVNAYSIRQTAHAIRTKAMRFDPDVVVAQLCLNDPYTSDTEYGATAPMPGSRLGLLLRRRVAPDRFWGFYFVERNYDAAGWENVRKGFRDLAGSAEARPVIAVLFPYLYEPAYAQWGYARYHEGFRKEAEAAGIPLLDLRPAFERAGLIGSRWPTDPIHPDARGHRVAAETILSELERRGLLPPR